MKLYFCPGHMSFAPHVVLHEIDQPFEAIAVSIKDGGTQSAHFKRINPKGKVPVLDTGTQILTESAAIMYYLAILHPQLQLLPGGALGVARAIEWTNWLAGVLAGPIGQILHPGRFTSDAQGYPGIADEGRAQLRARYAEIDSRLAGRDWALEDGYSIVDPALLIFFRWGNVLKLDMRQYPNWCGHCARMEQRPAVQATLETEGFAIWD